MAFRIHGVTRKFIDGLKAAGLNERDSDNLVAFRIHGVTPEMVQARSRGRLHARERGSHRDENPRRHARMDG